MKIKSEDLKNAFAVVDNVAANPVLESSQFVRIQQDADKLSFSLTGATRSESSLKGASAGGRWTEYADRRLLKAFMSSCSSKEVDVFFKPKEKLTFRADQRLEIASHVPVMGYEAWKPGKSAKLSPEHRAMLATAVKYLPTNMAGVENMNGVWFGKDMAIATDSISMLGFYGFSSASEHVIPAEVSVFLAANDAGVSVDADGVGAVMPHGYVYQSRSTQLDSYPHSAARAKLNEGHQAKPMMEMLASDLLGTLTVASQFMFDKGEACRMESSSGGLLITVDMPAGKFQRTVKASGSLNAPVDISAKRIIPWLEYAGSSRIKYAKLADCSAFRFGDKKNVSVLLVADV